MADSLPADKDTETCNRRRLLRLFLNGWLLSAAAAVAACGTRKDLPPERRTRGRYGHRGD